MSASDRLRILTSALFVVAVFAACAQPESADVASATDDAEAAVVYSPLDQGRAAYLTYCQGCHGADGNGAGPVAELLTVAPPNLTDLVVRYGEFPEELVYMTIDGRQQVQGHGTREMPVWGNIWNDPMEGPVAEERIEEQIGYLVEYILSIQVEPSGD